MKHGLICTLGSIVLILVAFTISAAQTLQPQIIPYKPPTNIIKATTLEQIRSAMAQKLFPQKYDSGWTRGHGLWAANYDLYSGGMWLATINDGRDNYSSYASCGFRSIAIQNVGAATWNNVTFTVIVQLLSHGFNMYNSRAGIRSAAYPLLNGKMGGFVTMSFMANGGQTLVTEATNLPPGGILQCDVYMEVSADRNSGGTAYAKTASITPNF